MTHPVAATAEPSAMTPIPGKRRLSLAPLRDYAVLVVLAVLIVALAVSNDSFRTTTNLTNVLSQCALVGIIACGVTMVFISGEFDLSVGSTYSVAGLVAAMTAKHVDGLTGLVVGAVAAIAIGVCNGLLVTLGRINAFMATLATSFLLAGLAVILTDGTPVLIESTFLTQLGQNQLFGLDFPVYILLVLAVALTLTLRYTKFGRRLYATGGSAEAARLSGVNVVFVKVAAFAISGGAAGLAGIVAAGQVSSADPNAGSNLLLMPIAAVVVGGVSIYGGNGEIWRAAAGVLLLVLINNGFNLLGFNPLYSQIVQGGVILVAVAIDAWSGKSNG
ncbi:MAG: ABC transporter permease [Nocardioides sp.]|uniref:ABC transporter permease n=1 Tax=Nocardioides sp. TaxID=35761 RepID=UPI0039E3A837